jgi:hypothetical protein
VLVIALAMGMVHPTTALAQSAEAEALFTDAARLFKAGRIDEACDAFNASNRIEPRAGTMIRLGECRERQGRLASAWSSYRDALTRVKDPHKKQVAIDRIAALEPTLSKLTIVVPEANRVGALAITRNGAAVDSGLWNRAIPTDGGKLVFVAKAPGFKDWTTTVTVPVANGNVRVDVPRLEPVPVAAEPPVAGGPDQRRQAERVGDVETAPAGHDAPPPSRMTNKRKIALGVGVIALGAGVTGVLLGRSAKGLEDDAYGLCPDPQTPCADAARAMDLVERGATRSTYANIAFGASAGAAVVATVLWLVGAPDREPSHRVSVTPRIEHGFAGAAMEGRF